jgi:organic radical activating enzyme
MNKLITKIYWNLSDHCKAECDYCPTHFRGGELIHETPDYLRVAKLLIDSYSAQGRIIDWEFDGGEPLDLDDPVTLLKLCRENGLSMKLHTNGGRLWLDWWAIEPYVDNLHLSYHYWQNPALVKYIVDTFQKKGKQFHVSIPIRPDHFEEDMARVNVVESDHGITVGKAVLYKNADRTGGMFNYNSEQLAIMSGVKIAKIREVQPPPVVEEIIKQAPLVKEKVVFETTTWNERYKETYSKNPVYTGQLCNVGVEHLRISHGGWVAGSNCNNQPLGNIWDEGWAPPSTPQVCTMLACVDSSDQKITKFPV